MSRVVVINHLTLDGVMQAPGRPDEDRRGGFEHGGWAQPYFDEVMGRALARGDGAGGALLFGRRTYEDFAGFWPHQTTTRSRRCSTTPEVRRLDDAAGAAPVGNSTLLQGDAVDGRGRTSRSGPGKDSWSWAAASSCRR